MYCTCIENFKECKPSSFLTCDFFTRARVSLYTCMWFKTDVYVCMYVCKCICISKACSLACPFKTSSWRRPKLFHFYFTMHCVWKWILEILSSSASSSYSYSAVTAPTLRFEPILIDCHRKRLAANASALTHPIALHLRTSC